MFFVKSVWIWIFFFAEWNGIWWIFLKKKNEKKIPPKKKGEKFTLKGKKNSKEKKVKHNKSQILEANFSAQGPRTSSSIWKRWMADCVWGNGEIALTDDLWIIVFLMLSSLCYLVPIELSAVLLPLFVNMQLKVCVYDDFFPLAFLATSFRCICFVALVLFSFL